jgi:hypothetical protein
MERFLTLEIQTCKVSKNLEGGSSEGKEQRPRELPVRHGRKKFGLVSRSYVRPNVGLEWVVVFTFSSLLTVSCLVRALRIDSVSWVASKFLDRWSKLGPVPVVPGLGTLDTFRLCVFDGHGLLASECRPRGSVRGSRGSGELIPKRNGGVCWDKTTK